MIHLNYYRSKLNKNLTTTFLVSIFAAMAVIVGVVPRLSLQTGEFRFSNIALADNLSDDNLQKYAKAAREIEGLRRSAFRQIETIVGPGRASQLACHQKNTINALPQDARTIAQDYCNQSEAIVKKYGLSISEFNNITKKIQQDSALQQKVQNMMR